MRRVPEAMPQTIEAADRVRRAARMPGTRGRAIDLVQALAAVECSFTVTGPESVPPGLLRDLVILTARLTGRTWLEGNAEASEVAAFTALTAAGEPPLLLDLDQILASVLRKRFTVMCATAA
jgi:hypothetical protein